MSHATLPTSALTERLRLVLCLVMLLEGLSASSINVLVAPLADDLQPSATGLSVAVTAFLVAYAGLLPLAGHFVDAGRALQLFRGGVLLFGVGSVVCAVAPTIEVVTLGRFLQGAGAALSTPAALALVTLGLPAGAHRNRWVARFGAMGAVGFSAGLVVPGLVTSWSGWRSAFVLMIPLVVVAAVASLRLEIARVGSACCAPPRGRLAALRPLDVPSACLRGRALRGIPRMRRSRRRPYPRDLLAAGPMGATGATADDVGRTDPVGIASGTVALMAAVIALAPAGDPAGGGGAVMLVAGIVALVAGGMWWARGRAVEPRKRGADELRKRGAGAVRVSMLTLGLVFAGVLSSILVLGLALAEEGYDAGLVGLLILPQPLCFSLFAGVGARATARCGCAPVALAGVAFIGSALLLVGAAGPGHPLAVLVAMAGVGVGLACCYPAASIGAVDRSSEEQRGSVISGLTVSQNVGGALGVAVLAAAGLVSGASAGFTAAMMLAAVMVALAAVVLLAQRLGSSRLDSSRLGSSRRAGAVA
ncbi:MFS transporter [Nocardioides sp. BGMRC 2183]|nr:MFS transporter [Nocardioides sp. BGMRC 2183]